MSGIAVGLVLVVGVVFGGFMLLSDGGGETSESARAELASVPAKPPWGKKATITQADLQKVKPIELWARMFKAQAMQPVWHTTTMRYLTPEPKQPLKFADDFRIYQTSINFRTKQWSHSEKSVIIDGEKQSTSIYRCVDGKVYWWYSEEWLGPRPARVVPCALKRVTKIRRMTTELTDGVSTGGLSAKQASAFVRGLLTWDGVNEPFKGKKLITVGKPKLVNHDGKQYVRLVVLPSIPIKAGFSIAFEETGLDARKYPYDNIGQFHERMLMIYYIDPATMLPAYAEFHAIKAKKGQVSEGSYIHHRVEYKYGGKIPQLTVESPPEPIELSWPPEQL